MPRENVELISNLSGGDPDSPTADALSLDGNGPESRDETKRAREIFATPSIVSDDEDSTAKGPDSGVEDHTIKLPLSCESSVRTK